jgi:hypothetical protein
MVEIGTQALHPCDGVARRARQRRERPGAAGPRRSPCLQVVLFLIAKREFSLITSRRPRA